MKKVFLDDLPKKQGLGKNINKSVIDWINSIGYKVKFIYDDIEGWIKIKEYIQKGKRPELRIEYINKELIIVIEDLRRCRLGKLLGKITKEFKIEIGTRFQDDKRDITIIDREYRKQERIDNKGRKNIVNWKYYKYHCNVCNWDEGWMEESQLIGVRKDGCICCSGKVAVIGINSIADTDKWMVKYFQGGIEEAKLYTSGTTQKIYPICPICKRVKDKKMEIRNIKKYHSIDCFCGDSIPYPEKLLFNILEQLGIYFQTQLNKTTFVWCDNYKYDFSFVLNNERYIIETHGLQHYEENTNFKMSLEEIQENDKIKKQLAIDNGIKEENYIVIDCKKSELEFIKPNVLKSNLDKIFDLSKINWLKAEDFACSTRIKEACDYKQNNLNLTTTEIGKLMKLHRCTIQKYLVKGSNLGWCYYNANEEKSKKCSKLGKLKNKPIEIYKEGISLGIFESATELERQSEKLFGVLLRQGNISDACANNKKYKGYTFKLI